MAELFDNHVFADMGNDVVTFLLVVIEEEPEGTVGVVGGGDVVTLTMQYGVGHHVVASLHGFLVGFGFFNFIDAVELLEIFIDDAGCNGQGHGVDIIVVVGARAVVFDGVVAHDDRGGGHERIGFSEVVQDIAELHGHVF